MQVGDRVCNTLTGTDYEPLLPAKTPASNVREARALQGFLNAELELSRRKMLTVGL